MDQRPPREQVPRGDARPRQQAVEHAVEGGGVEGRPAVEGQAAAALPDQGRGRDGRAGGERRQRRPGRDRLRGRRRRPGGGGHGVDLVPPGVVRAEPVRPAEPGAARRGRRDGGRVGQGGGADQDEGGGVLAVGRVEAGEPVPVQAEPGGHGGVPGVVQQPGRPAEGGGRVPDGGEGVAGVVLAVPEGPRPVLPRLPPVDRRQPDQEAPGRQGGREGGRLGRGERAAAAPGRGRGWRSGRPRRRARARSGRTAYPSVGWRLPLDGLHRRAHRAVPYSFQADSPRASSNRTATELTSARLGPAGAGSYRSA